MTTQLEADVLQDPDAQATVIDFLDYTEYLPSDLARSLTLIGKLDESYLSAADNVHQLSAAYALLPNASPTTRPSSKTLRQQISISLDRAISAREASSAEASRLYDVVDRHYNRLTSIISKLNYLPKPPSRDPTPAPPIRSPQLSRAKTALKEGQDGTPPRIMLRFEGSRASASAGRVPSLPVRSRYRSQKIMIPGEVLPPPNPDSPPQATDSEWELRSPSPAPVATSRVGVASRSRPSKPARVRISKVPKTPRIKIQKVSRPPRPPGAMGTNVHSAVAGISTSNALSLLDPPPPDAKPGSEHAPWMRLTEWEMAKLRKRMKKNAIWSPSETMIRRELSDAGRGPENYRSSKARADAFGEEFVDDDKIATTAPGKPLAPGEISADSLGLEETQLSNRGMKLNEAKKLKREIMQREQAALAAAEAEQAAKRLGDIGSTFRDLFTKPGGVVNSARTPIAIQPNIKHTEKDKAKGKGKDKEKEQEQVKQRQQEKERQLAKEKELAKERALAKEKELAKERDIARERELAKEREQEKERKQEQEKIRAQEQMQEQKKEMERAEREGKQNEEEQEKETENVKVSIKKRKRETSPNATTLPLDEIATSPSKPTPSKKRRATLPHPPPLNTSSNTRTTTVPLAPAAPSPPIPVTPGSQLKSPTETYRASAPSTRSRHLSLNTKAAAPQTEPSRPSSRAASRRGSTVGPSSATIGRENLRRRSTTPAAATPIITAAGRRSKRPAPGPVTNSLDGGAAVSEGRRKNAPRKRGSAAAAHARRQAEDAGLAREREEEAKAEEEMAGEDIDPDEPRYCVCGDVSFGTMICCENAEVSCHGLSGSCRPCYEGVLTWVAI